jgi:hypothetical protein
MPFNFVIGSLPVGIGAVIFVLIVALLRKNYREAVESQARVDRCLRLYPGPGE